MVNAVVEVEAPRDITRQLLRHRSFSFQEFSQRYSDEIEFTDREFRRQDDKNRQNSVDDLEEEFEECLAHEVSEMSGHIKDTYFWMRGNNVAKECARVILPEGLTMSRLYVNGTLRSWLHYLDVRDDPGVTQWEHVVMARKIKDVLVPAFPTVFNLTGNQ
jgi:thymidylate synthase (FAD)